MQSVRRAGRGLSAAPHAFVATGAKILTLSGGEPTLRHEQLLALARQARDRGIPFVERQTNAVLIDSVFAQELAQSGVTSAFVSLRSDPPLAAGQGLSERTTP